MRGFVKVLAGGALLLIAQWLSGFTREAAGPAWAAGGTGLAVFLAGGWLMTKGWYEPK